MADLRRAVHRQLDAARCTANIDAPPGGEIRNGKCAGYFAIARQFQLEPAVQTIQRGDIEFGTHLRSLIAVRSIARDLDAAVGDLDFPLRGRQWRVARATGCGGRGVDRLERVGDGEPVLIVQMEHHRRRINHELFERFARGQQPPHPRGQLHPADADDRALLGVEDLQPVDRAGPQPGQSELLDSDFAA